MDFLTTIIVIMVFFIGVISNNVVGTAISSKPLQNNCTCGSLKGLEDVAFRIVGGSIMRDKEHPGLAVIQLKNVFICGGSVISRRHVLTAAHCLPPRFPANYYSVVLGVHDRIKQDSGHIRKYPVQEIIIHEHYRKLENDVLENDIALLVVGEIEFSDYIQPLCLPFDINPALYESAVVDGWGFTKPKGKTTRFPRRAFLSVITWVQCRKSKLNTVLQTVENFEKMALCAYRVNTDSCQGDSGGPLFIKTEKEKLYQIGIVSFGVGCGNADGIPGLYTKLSSYQDWLKQHLKGFICKPSP